MENESSWVVNGIITVALLIFVLPAAAGHIEDLPALALWILLMYVTYTAFSGEAIDPPRPK